MSTELSTFLKRELTYAGQYSDSTGAVTPQASIPSSAPAPTQAYQSAPAQSAQPSYQTPSVQQPVDQAPQAYQPQAAPGQPMAGGIQSTQRQPELSAELPSPGALLNATTQQVPTQQEAPSSPSPVSYQSAPSVSGMQTYLPQANAGLFPGDSGTGAELQHASRPHLASDEYLASVSAESLEVLQHFGAEAPALLNRYSCVVEDALLAQAQQTADTLEQLEKMNIAFESSKKVIDAAAEDNAAYHVMLTDPDMLSAYVNDFFGPEGPYPVETAEDRLAAEMP